MNLEIEYLQKGYEFSSFAKNMKKNIGIDIIKDLRSKYNQNFIDHNKESATSVLKTNSKRAFRKPQEQLVIWLFDW